MANDIEAWIVGHSNFWGVGFNEFLRCSRFGERLYSATLANRPDIPTIHFIEHPTLGKFTTYVWQLPCPNTEMNQDEFGRPVGAEARSYGILIEGHRVIRISEAQRKLIERRALPCYEAEWNRCRAAFPEIAPFRALKETSAVEPKSLPSIRFTEVPLGQGIREYSLGKQFQYDGMGFPKETALTSDDVRRVTQERRDASARSTR